MNFSEKFIFLKSKYPFSTLDDDSLAVIANACFYYYFPPESVIVSESELAMHLFIAIDSDIIYKDKKYKIFSIPALLEGGEYLARATADSAVGTKCLVLSREHFHSIIKNEPKLLLGFAEGKE